MAAARWLSLARAAVCALAATLPLLINHPSLAAAPPPIGALIGIGLTPAHFPRQSDQDVARMFAAASGVGQVAMILGGWADPSFPAIATQMMQATDRDQFRTVIGFDIFERGGVHPAPPPGVSGRGFGRATADAYARSIADLAGQHPDSIIAALDANRLLASGTDRLAEFAQAYKQAYAAAKAVSPETKLMISFNYDLFLHLRDDGHIPLSDIRKLVDLFRPDLDAIAFSATLSDKFHNPADIPADYFDAILQLRDREDVVLLLGWSSNVGGEAAQARFVDRLPELTGKLHPSMVIWPILHDIPTGDVASGLGLYTSDEREKPAAASFRLLRGPPATQRALPVSAPPATTEIASRNPSDRFRIMTNTLDGTRPALIATDPRREMNHARLSPDGSRVVFTRYNHFNADGVALETNGYQQTEIVACQVTDAKCDVVVPARRGIASANAMWLASGKGLLFVTNDTATRDPVIATIDLATRQLTWLDTGADVELADPNLVGSRLVAPGRVKGGPPLQQLYLFDVPSMRRRVLTRPHYANLVAMAPLLGDHDPKLSPDGKFVAVMRHMDLDDWSVVVVDAATGAEQNLSALHAVDAVPEWSSDGRLLMFWHVDRADLPRSGLYVMRPDGTDRRQIPLPHGFFYTMPAFVPGSGSGPDARIIYSAQPDPRL